MNKGLAALDPWKRTAVLSIACLAWLIAVLVLDHFWTFRYHSTLGHALEAEFDVSVPGQTLKLPSVSLLVLLGVPMVALGLLLVPWTKLLNRRSWVDSFVRWCQPIFWLLMALFLGVIGQSIYDLSKEHLPASVVNLSEAFAIGVKITSWDKELYTVDGQLSALVGLLIGIYLFVHKGIRGAVD